MKANDFYDNIHSLQYETNCTAIRQHEWNKLMKKSVRANVYKINKLVRELLPDIAQSLNLFDKPLKDLGWYNPYNYYRTKTHLILVHSHIEHFIRINV